MPISSNVELGKDVQIFHPDLVNLYGCAIGDGTRIGTFVEIQIGAKIGSRCKISSHTFICEGVTIEDEVFVGHGVMFINDKFPTSFRVQLQTMVLSRGLRTGRWTSLAFVDRHPSDQTPRFCAASRSVKVQQSARALS